MNELTHAGFFEGIGGFSLGANRVGIKTIYTCELDDFRHNWLKHILPDSKHEKDITKAIGCYADIYTSGFPCQDVSRANPKGKGINGARSGLYYVFMEHVRNFRPGYVVLENSPFIISKGYLLGILGDFASIGYNAEWQTLSKHSIGYPDERERFFLVAYSNKIGCTKGYTIFNKKSYEKCVKTLKQNEFIFNKLGRKNSLNDWIEFITGILQNDAGLPKELVKNHIAAYGDSVCPDLAQLIFQLIKLHYESIQTPLECFL